MKNATPNCFLRFRSSSFDSIKSNKCWPAPGSEDTKLGVLMEPEVGHGETKVYTRVQARGRAADQGSWRVVCASRGRPGCASVAASQLGEGVCGRSAACVPWARSDEARAVGDCAVEARGHQAEGRARHPKKSRGLLRE